MSPLLDMQMRFRLLGRIRPGEKGAKGEPKKRTTWRLTSASRRLLEQGQVAYGGELREWTGAPSEGFWELLTETAELDVMIPPVADSSTLLSQNYELWSGGGCKRRCDGVTQENGKPCVCDADNRECKPKTRLSVMLPRIPDIGVWRIDSDGVNAALEIPGTLGLLVQAANGNFLPASLRLEQRVSKKEGEPTRRFVVPVLEMPYAGVSELAEAAATGKPMLLAASYASGKPALPAGSPPPAGGDFGNGARAGFGAPPPLPDSGDEPQPDDGRPAQTPPGSAQPGDSPTVAAPSSPDAPLPTKKQIDKLNVLVGQLRDGGHVTTKNLWDSMHRTYEYSEDGELHWGPLRDSLSREEASELIDRLQRFQDSLAVA